MMALNASVINFFTGSLNKIIGVAVNKYFVGITNDDIKKKDLSKIQILIYINLI